ncbi:unnamed protein product, partial [Acanthoscelides obtectus]
NRYHRHPEVYFSSLADRGPDSAEQLNEDEFVVALIEKDGVSGNATCWHTVYLRR